MPRERQSFRLTKRTATPLGATDPAVAWMGMRMKRDSFCKKTPASIPQQPCTQQGSPQLGRSPLEGTIPLVLQEQQHNSRPSLVSLSGHQDHRPLREEWKGHPVCGQQELPHYLAPTITSFWAQSCPPSVGRLTISRHRRQGRHGWGCKHHSPMVSLTRHQHDRY